MNQYELFIKKLEDGNDVSIKVYGNSMTPLLKSGVVLTFRKTNDYQIGDVVFSKVKGRIIQAHKITKIDGNGRYLISNNKGHDNGWTRQVFGRVIKADDLPFGRVP